MIGFFSNSQSENHFGGVPGIQAVGLGASIAAALFAADARAAACWSTHPVAYAAGAHVPAAASATVAPDATTLVAATAFPKYAGTYPSQALCAALGLALTALVETVVLAHAEVTAATALAAQTLIQHLVLAAAALFAELISALQTTLAEVWLCDTAAVAAFWTHLTAFVIGYALVALAAQKGSAGVAALSAAPAVAVGIAAADIATAWIEAAPTNPAASTVAAGILLYDWTHSFSVDEGGGTVGSDLTLSRGLVVWNRNCQIWIVSGGPGHV